MAPLATQHWLPKETTRALNLFLHRNLSTLEAHPSLFETLYFEQPHHPIFYVPQSHFKTRKFLEHHSFLHHGKKSSRLLLPALGALIAIWPNSDPTSHFFQITLAPNNNNILQQNNKHSLNTSCGHMVTWMETTWHPLRTTWTTLSDHVTILENYRDNTWIPLVTTCRQLGDNLGQL